MSTTTAPQPVTLGVKRFTVRRVLEIGGFVAGAVLILFGAAAIFMAIDGRSTVRDSLTAEKIVGGSDMSPAAITKAVDEAGLTGLPGLVIPSKSVADKEIKTGEDARVFAQYMRIHALEASGGLTYSEMGRYAVASGKPIGTNDPMKAVTDKNGQPVANAARDTWVTETALTTALNMSFMAEQLALFGGVVGIALLLSGFGFIILAYAALHRRKES